MNYEGQSGPVASFGGFNTSPNWQATAWLTYARNRFTTTLETRYIGSGSLERDPIREPAWSGQQYAAVLDDDQQRRRPLLSGLVGIL